MHQITTDDDYIIMLHRIPYPKGQTSGITGRPILIFPGLMGGTEGFVMAQSEDALSNHRNLFLLFVSKTFNLTRQISL